eukprot:jgi/Botrbrau1/14077/Bobra.182_3s0024.1
MNALMSEKAALESRNRVLEQVVKLNIDHEKKLHCHKEIMSREQELLLEELAAFRGRVEGVPAAPLSEAKDWTMSAWLDSIFPRYMQRLKVLLTESKGSSSESSLAAAELQALVATRRVQEGRRALFSCFYPAVYSWNREEMEGGATPPASSHWAAVLEGLRLTREQEQKVSGSPGGSVGSPQSRGGAAGPHPVGPGPGAPGEFAGAMAHLPRRAAPAQEPGPGARCRPHLPLLPLR